MKIDAHVNDFMRLPENAKSAAFLAHTPTSYYLKTHLLQCIKNERNYLESTEHNSEYCRGKIQALKELYYNLFKEEV